MVGAKAFKGVLVRPAGVGTWTFVRIPFDLAAAAGTRAQVRVRGKINGVSYETNALPDGKGSHFMVVNGALRKRIAAEAGDAVSFTAELDPRPRPISVPADLQRALKRRPRLLKMFKALAPSHQRRYIGWITEAKGGEARERRVAAALKRMANGER
ncbi:MAG TPA: YdeI/OmpD-associated family protein [Gemmatimonadaceae bacterium]|nr:YdeI/OmpD-associated family protein [Gemmatimonadaceae bacterium]